MNKTHLISLLQNPVAATTADEAALRDITRAYPYFQAARVVFTKCLHQQHSYLFEKELKTTALHAGSRSKLYHYIHTTPVEDSTPEQETSVVIPEEPIEVISNQPPVVEVPAEPALPEIVAHTSEPAETPVAPIAEVEVSDHITDTLPPAIEIETEVEDQVEVESEIEVASEATTEISSETEPSIMSTLPKVETAITTEVGEESLPPVELASPHSFDEWLSLLTEHRLPETFTENTEKHPAVAKENITSEVETTPASEETPQPTQQPVHHIPTFDPDNIIERFIAESPSISRPKAEFFNPVNMAKLSVEEDEDLVTETLARINAKQGNYKKAIRMYEKLCLKFPEKMPYFVDLIQKIKSEHKLD